MKSVIIGAGTYGEVFLAYLQEAGVEIIGFIDDAPKSDIVRGIPILGGTNSLPLLREKYGVDSIYCPLGDNKLRVKFLSYAKELGYQIPNFIHPSVIVSPNVIIGEGVYILLGTTIMPFTVIHDYSMVSMGVHIAHHSVLEEGVFLSTGCNFGASIIARKYSYCGISSTIMTGIHELGEDCLIGAGAVVIRDVESYAIVAGVPAKVIKYKKL